MKRKRKEKDPENLIWASDLLQKNKKKAKNGKTKK